MLTLDARTGASGYIGGDVLYAVSQAHPDWEITALVRSKDKAAQITSKYPKIKIAHGDLDAKDLIEEKVKNSDIVYRQYLIILIDGAEN